MKRNFLGDILHSLTGVATDEQLQQQMRLDEEIREQVVSLLHHQAITDKGVTDMLSAVAQEEDNLSDRLGTLQQQHDQDVSSSNRLLAFLSIVTSDIRLLECTLSSMSAGIAPPYLSSLLSLKSGLSTYSPYRYLHTFRTAKGVSVEYTSTLFTESEILGFLPAVYPGAVFLRTRLHNFLLPASYTNSTPVSELEVRFTNVSCFDCAVLLHYESSIYRVLVPGTMSCVYLNRTEHLLSVANNSLADLSPYLGCQNRQISLGRVGLTVSTYVANTNDVGLDSLLLARDSKTKNISAPHPSLSRDVTAGRVKILKGLSEAKDDIDALSRLTLSNPSLSAFHITSGVAWLIALTVLCLPVFLLLLYNFYRRSSSPSKS